MKEFFMWGKSLFCSKGQGSAETSVNAPGGSVVNKIENSGNTVFKIEINYIQRPRQ